MQVHTSSTGILWPFFLDSCTPGQGCISQYIHAMVHGGMYWYSLVSCHGAVYLPLAIRICTSMYQYCGSTYRCIVAYFPCTLLWRRLFTTDNMQYVPLCTSTFDYVPVHIGLYVPIGNCVLDIVCNVQANLKQYAGFVRLNMKLLKPVTSSAELSYRNRIQHHYLLCLMGILRLTSPL